MKPSARHQSRRLALQALYEKQLTNNPILEIEKHFLEDCDSKKVDVQYFSSLLKGSVQYIDQTDKLMTPYLSRPIAEISPIELSVLRLAIFELAYRPDVPYRVIINEALELAKEFGAAEGHRFVNGVLDQVSKQLRRDEINGPK